jgi:membrane protease YdiL (CAAX protease family)
MIFSSPFFGMNLNVLLSLMLAIIFGLIPVELGILKFIASKERKKIREIILFQNKTPLKKIVLPIIISFVIASACFVFIPLWENNLWNFDFMHHWLRMDKVNFAEINHLKLTIILVLIFNGFLGPIVEEIYFRGYLLPRMGKLGKFAPFVNVLIFSIYHFHMPWQNITRIVAITPMAYSVWKFKDIRIGMVVHCLLNTFGNVAIIMTLL